MVTATPHEDLEAYFADREADCRYCSGSGEREMSDTTSGPNCHTEIVSCPYCLGTGARMDCLPVPADRHQGWPGVYAVLYTDAINDEQACRDDLWIATGRAIRCVVEKAQANAYAEGRKDEAEECDRLRAALRRLHDWVLTQEGDCMFSGDHPIAQAAAALAQVSPHQPRREKDERSKECVASHRT